MRHQLPLILVLGTLVALMFTDLDRGDRRFKIYFECLAANGPLKTLIYITNKVLLTDGARMRQEPVRYGRHVQKTGLLPCAHRETSQNEVETLNK
jgi:hypothetical protein